MARLHREAREEERDQPGRNGRAPDGIRAPPGVGALRGRRGSRVRVGRDGDRRGHHQDEPREHEEGHAGEGESFEQGADPDDGRDVADRSPEPDVDVPRRPFAEPAQGQRLELRQHPLPEEAEHEERREEAPESGRRRDGRERGERPGRRDAHHPLARSGPVGGVPPQPRGDELGDRQRREEHADGPRFEPPVEQVRREVREEHPGRREVREIPDAEPRLAAPRAYLPPGRGHRRVPAAIPSFTPRGGLPATESHRERSSSAARRRTRSARAGPNRQADGSSRRRGGLATSSHLDSLPLGAFESARKIHGSEKHPEAAEDARFQCIELRCIGDRGCYVPACSLQ